MFFWNTLVNILQDTWKVIHLLKRLLPNQRSEYCSNFFRKVLLKHFQRQSPPPQSVDPKSHFWPEKCEGSPIPMVIYQCIKQTLNWIISALAYQGILQWDYFRHKTVMISPTIFESNGISVKKTVQSSKQVVILLPGTFHFGNTSYLFVWFKCFQQFNQISKHHSKSVSVQLHFELRLFPN